MTAVDAELPCPACHTTVADHTIRGWRACLQAAHMDFSLPYLDNPDGPVIFPGLEGHLAGEVTVSPGFIDSPIGRHPVLRFVFSGPGAEPMSRVARPPINLVLDAAGLKAFRQLVSTAVDRAILAARRGR